MGADAVGEAAFFAHLGEQAAAHFSAQNVAEQPQGRGVIVVDAKGAKTDREVHLVGLAHLLNVVLFALPRQLRGRRLIGGPIPAAEEFLGKPHDFIVGHPARDRDNRVARGVPVADELAHMLGLDGVDRLLAPDDADLEVEHHRLEHLGDPDAGHVFVHLELLQDDVALPVPLVHI